MKTGPVLSGVIALLAVVGLTAVFVQNASPYVAIKDLPPKSDGVHVVGKIVPDTLKQSGLDGSVQFKLTDGTGQIDVHYSGPAISSLSSATQVVVIGSMADHTFESKQMLVKCPSKYEASTARS